MLKSNAGDRETTLQARRVLLMALALLGGIFMLAACGRVQSEAREAATTDSPSSITIEELPEGIGRGFPIAFYKDETSIRMLAVGETAPNFQLKDEDGHTVWLQDLKGQPVMINFWATWCGPCRIEMPDIVNQARETEDLIVLAVNVQEDLEAVQKFAEEFEMLLPVPLDKKGDVRNLYQVRGMPTSVFIDRDGNIAATWAGLLTPDKLSELVAKIL